jgi:DNA-binding beta-propeller fold protein YncE
MSANRPAVALLLPMVVGCAPVMVDPLSPQGPARVWPPAPDVPRIRYLGALTGSDDVQPQRTMEQILREMAHGPAAPSRLGGPHAVAVHADDGRIAVADVQGQCVHVFDLPGRTYTRHTTCGENGESFSSPVAVAWMADTLWVADAQLHALAVLSPDGSSKLVGRDRLRRPAGLAVCPDRAWCYVADAGAHAVLAFDHRGTVAEQFGSQGAGPDQLNFPSHLCCGPDETLFVADSLNFRIQRFGLDGAPRGAFGRKGDAAGDLALPKGVAADPDGNVWVVDAQFENIQGFTPDGKLLLAFGGEGREPGMFWLPAGICISPDRRMWVADTYNRRVQVFELLRSD